MSPPVGRARLTHLVTLVSFVLVVVLLGLLAWRLTPPEGPPLKRARRGAGRAPIPDDASLVLITIDGLRADRLGSYGEAPLSPTPHLDRLASEGFRFEQAISPTPWSFPAHAAILTGDDPVGSSGLEAPGGAIPADRATLAEILRSSGFRTAAFVGTAAVGRATGLARGFDRFDAPEAAGRPATIRWLAERPASEVIDQARAWLDENFRLRFFLWVQLADPTPPHPAVARGVGRREPYDAEVETVDGEVGRLLGRLDSLGVTGHTLVALAGTFGEGLGEHGESGAGAGLYDATIRVPMLLRLPGVPARDRSIPEQVRLFDLAPTLLDLLRLAAPLPTDGTSLVPLLDPGGTLPDLPAVADAGPALSLLGAPARRALRAGGWKLIEGPPEKLYDLRRDPGETRNLAAAQTGRVRDLRRQMLAAWPAAATRRPLAVGTAGVRTPALSSVTPLLAEALGALRGADGPRARRALEDLRHALAPASPPGLLALLGGALQLQGRDADALALYEQALPALRVAGPETAPPADGAGTAAPGVERPTPLRGLVESGIGACRIAEGHPDAALAAYRAAAAARPDDLDDRLTLAGILIDTGAPEAAIDEIRAALARAPHEPSLLAGLGRAYLAAGQPSAAILPLQDALRASPFPPRPLYDLGRAYEALDRPADALRAYEDFLARVSGPGDPLYHAAGERVRALRQAS